MHWSISAACRNFICAWGSFQDLEQIINYGFLDIMVHIINLKPPPKKMQLLRAGLLSLEKCVSAFFQNDKIEDLEELFSNYHGMI